MGLLSFPAPTRVPAVCGLLDLLAHPFPRVRRQAAEALTTGLIVAGDALAGDGSDTAGTASFLLV